MESKRVAELLAEVMKVEASTLAPDQIISPDNCSAFGWRALHLGYGCFKIGLAEQPRTVAEICEWYKLAEQ